MRLPAPNLEYASEVKNAFRFTEKNSDPEFFVLLKFITYPDGSQISLSVKILENILEYPEWNSYAKEKKLSYLCLPLERKSPHEKLWMIGFKGRNYFQHPVRKWWISTIIKREVIASRRMKSYTLIGPRGRADYRRKSLPDFIPTLI